MYINRAPPNPSTPLTQGHHVPSYLSYLSYLNYLSYLSYLSYLLLRE